MNAYETLRQENIKLQTTIQSLKIKFLELKAEVARLTEANTLLREEATRRRVDDLDDRSEERKRTDWLDIIWKSKEREGGE